MFLHRVWWISLRTKLWRKLQIKKRWVKTRLQVLVRCACLPVGRQQAEVSSALELRVRQEGLRRVHSWYLLVWQYWNCWGWGPTRAEDAQGLWAVVYVCVGNVRKQKGVWWGQQILVKGGTSGINCPCMVLSTTYKYSASRFNTGF